jgi:predicted oxidoreductase
MTETIPSSDVNSSSAASAADSFSQAPSPAPEKMLPQSEVNHLVARYKNEAYEKGKQEALAALNKQNESSVSHATINPAQAQSMGGIQQMSPAEIEKLVRDQVSNLSQKQQEEAQNAYYQSEINRVAGEINSKLSDAKTRYQDFDSVVSPDVLRQLPDDVLMMANQFENAGDLLYDLLKNPTKFAPINANLMTARMNNAPYFNQVALSQMREISSSIKANQDAVANHPRVNNPLSQVNPSVAASDSGNKTISDLRKASWLRA